MLNKKKFGNIGEKIAKEYLEKNGYEIIDNNFSSIQGEIDIIAKDNNEIVFIEVKTRRNKRYGMPVDAVDIRKKEHIFNTAKYFLYKNNVKNIQIRFDVIEVYVVGDKARINHIKQITD